jgi:putative phosphoribosyl transferase
MDAFLPFPNRKAAAHALAQALRTFRGHHPLVLALPRGGVPIAQVVAAELGGELDIVQARKLGAPFNPEFAIGAVAEDGWRYLNGAAEVLGISASDVEAATERELRRMRERRALWMRGRTAHSPHGRLVIVVDDGVATGASMIAALHALRAQQPARLVCAVPVAARDSLIELRALADDLICLAAPTDFRAVGQYYQDFSQVDDAEVAAILTTQASAANPKPEIVDDHTR